MWIKVKPLHFLPGILDKEYNTNIRHFEPKPVPLLHRMKFWALLVSADYVCQYPLLTALLLAWLAEFLGQGNEFKLQHRTSLHWYLSRWEKSYSDQQKKTVKLEMHIFEVMEGNAQGLWSGRWGRASLQTTPLLPGSTCPRRRVRDLTQSWKFY